MNSHDLYDHAVCTMLLLAAMNRGEKRKMHTGTYYTLIQKSKFIVIVWLHISILENDVYNRWYQFVPVSKIKTSAEHVTTKAYRYLCRRTQRNTVTNA